MLELENKTEAMLMRAECDECHPGPNSPCNYNQPGPFEPCYDFKYKTRVCREAQALALEAAQTQDITKIGPWLRWAIGWLRDAQ